MPMGGIWQVPVARTHQNKLPKESDGCFEELRTGLETRGLKRKRRPFKEMEGQHPFGLFSSSSS